MRGRRPALKAIAGGKDTASAISLPPAHVPRSMRKEWLRVVSDLQSRKLLVDVALPVVASYCVALWQTAECMKALQQDGMFTRTKNGEPRPHPAVGVLNKLHELVARLSAELGITPAARSRKGLAGPQEPDHDGAPAGLDI